MFGRLTSIAFICLLFRQTKSSTQFTLDPCCQDTDCAEERTCVFVDTSNDSFETGPCTPGREECICAQGVTGIIPCAVDFDCLVGDLCDNSGPSLVCVSQCLLEDETGLELNDDESALCDNQPKIPMVCPLENPMDSGPSEKPEGNGLNDDSCSKTSDCMPPRKCLSLEAPSKECETGEECQCNREALPTPSPNSQPLSDPNVEPSPGTEEPTASDEAGEPSSSPTIEDLDAREPTPSVEAVETPQIVVATPPSVDVVEVAETTLPPEVTESPEPTTAVCVAVEELEGVQKVFEQDYHAWVLCDTAGSCATPGHMVMWNGVGMMMKSYCDVAGCERKVKAVNSPRWSAGAIRAKTKGLAYTSFAARWESRAEERVLAAVVRLAV